MPEDPQKSVGKTLAEIAAASGRVQIDPKVFERMREAGQLQPFKVHPPLAGGKDTPPTGGPDNEEPGQIAGGKNKPKDKARARGGKVVARGGRRLMIYWELLESELNELAGLQADARRSFAWSAFFGALALDLLRDVLTSTMPATENALWIGLALGSAALAIWAFFTGRHAQNRGATRLQEIKDQHDHD